MSRDDVAELCVELLSQPVAAGVTFEVKSTVPFSTPWQPDPSQPPPPRDWKVCAPPPPVPRWLKATLIITCTMDCSS